MHELTVNHFSFVEHQSEPYISGIEICRRLGYKRPKHQSSQVWKKNEDFLHGNSTVFNLRTVDGKFREVRCFNEAGALFFITQCDIKKAKGIVKEMCDAFVKFRRMHDESKVSHSAIRAEEKRIFKEVMDGVQTFQNYQKAQGSKNFKHVYSNVIRTVKSQLGFAQSTKPCDMDSRQLVLFGTGLMTFEESLKQGMVRSLPYKEVYAEAKGPLKSLATNIKPLIGERH